MNKKKKKTVRKTRVSGRLLIPGFILFLTGFAVLSFADSRAENWAGYAAPFIFLAGWSLIAAGLWRSEQ